MLAFAAGDSPHDGTARAATAEPDRSPVDLILTPDGRYLLVANQTADTISLIELSSGRVTAEVPCGRRPAALALTPDGRRALVSASYGGELTVFERSDDRLDRAGVVRL